VEICALIITCSYVCIKKNSSTDENIKKTAIVEDNAKQEDKEKQK
jgi:hypothetical protein